MEKKIDALKKTIYNLENDVVVYKWQSPESCNCGVLAQSILGKSIYEAGYHKAPESPDIDRYGVFAGRALCMTTGLPLPEVFQALKDCGFTRNDLLELEYLGNKNISERIGAKVNCSPFSFPSMTGCSSFSNKETLIRYLKAWVEILEEEKLNSEQEAQLSGTTEAEQGTVLPKPKEVHHYYRIPNDVMEELKEMSVPEILDSN